jgi:hypothetical protein
MGSRIKVQTYTQRAIHAEMTDEKLNAIAHAIYELADFIDDLENQLARIDRKIR